jgi:hypothetical protein
MKDLLIKYIKLCIFSKLLPAKLPTTTTTTTTTIATILTT